MRRTDCSSSLNDFLARTSFVFSHLNLCDIILFTFKKKSLLNLFEDVFKLLKVTVKNAHIFENLQTSNLFGIIRKLKEEFSIFLHVTRHAIFRGATRQNIDMLLRQRQ